MKITFITFFLLLTGILQSKPIDFEIIYEDQSSIKALDYNIFILKDSLSNISYKNVQTNTGFKPSKLGLPNLGVSSFTYWVKFSIRNKTSSENLLLQLSAPLLDTANLFFTDENGLPVEIQLGNNRPFKYRKYKNQNYIYDVHIKQNQSQTFYLKIHGTEQICLPLTLGTPELIDEENSINDILVGLYGGIILAMFFYNFFIYFTIQDKSYLAYVLYIFFIGLTQIVIPGYGFKILWPEWYSFNSIATTLFAACGTVFAISFLKIFLKTDVHTPKFHICLNIFQVSFILAPVLHIIGYGQLGFTVIQVATLFLCIFILIVATKIFLLGFRPAKFFLIAWVILMLSSISFILKDFGFLPYNVYTQYAMQIGSSLEVMLLSFALADRINVLKKEKDESQILALSALKQNESMITNQNIVLEKNVFERTKELQQTNIELLTTLTELKHTQSKLVSTEKLASLGQLTAGIAHEINNPINFVVSNVKPLKRDIADIYELISKYEAFSTTIASKSKLEGINKFKSDIDYTFIKKEITDLVKGIEDGATRTAQIAKGLKVFSKMDEAEPSYTNIVEAINSTLTLLNSEISESIDLVKDYSKIPDIECYPGKINQVFMNILNNAIFAIKEHKLRKEKGELIISISSTPTHAVIRIKDNGIGMNDFTRKRIFEPFYTTKKAGKGTGLGLSISLSIINDHNGTIEVYSEYEKGTEFIVSLPIHLKI